MRSHFDSVQEMQKLCYVQRSNPKDLLHKVWQRFPATKNMRMKLMTSSLQWCPEVPRLTSRILLTMFSVCTVKTFSEVSATWQGVLVDVLWSFVQFDLEMYKPPVFFLLAARVLCVKRETWPVISCFIVITWARLEFVTHVVWHNFLG